MENFQSIFHDADFNYVVGSPHLKHRSIKDAIISSLTDAVSEQIRIKGKCRVLEVGAGHGNFTNTLLAAGGTVTVTEMSGHSAALLQERFSRDRRVTVIYDCDGSWLARQDATFDVVVCISVLHHIPNYLDFIHVAFDKVSQEGSFISWQDPMWYPRRTKLNLACDRLAYLAWRSTRGNYRQGFQTRLRRVRGVLDETNAADMVEYHVVRQGLDEEKILEVAANSFDQVEITRYFSTQSGLLQRLAGWEWTFNTFALIAGSKRYN